MRRVTPLLDVGGPYTKECYFREYLAGKEPWPLKQACICLLSYFEYNVRFNRPPYSPGRTQKQCAEGFGVTAFDLLANEWPYRDALQAAELFGKTGAGLKLEPSGLVRPDVFVEWACANCLDTDMLDEMQAAGSPEGKTESDGVVSRSDLKGMLSGDTDWIPQTDAVWIVKARLDEVRAYKGPMSQGAVRTRLAEARKKGHVQDRKTGRDVSIHRESLQSWLADEAIKEGERDREQEDRDRT